MHTKVIQNKHVCKRILLEKQQLNNTVDRDIENALHFIYPMQACKQAINTDAS